MLKPECKYCTTGDIHVINFKAWKSKKISVYEFAVREKELGFKCVACKYNGIGGRNAKKLKRENGVFQTLDHFSPNEVYDTLSRYFEAKE